MANVSTTAERRLPENVSQVAHRARVIHQSLSAPFVAAEPGLRVELKSDPALVSLDVKVKQALERALASAKDAAGAAAVMRLAKQEAVRALDKTAQRCLFEVLGTGNPPAALVRELDQLIQRPGFDKLSPRTQHALFAAFSGFLGEITLRRAVGILPTVPGFLGLEVKDQLELVAHLVGPTTAEHIAPMRKNRLELTWSARRAELFELLRRKTFSTAKVELQVEMLRDFIHAPARDVAFLNATELNGHAVIVFGEPADARSWSYGRRWVLSADKRSTAKIYSPDPTVQSGWKKPAVDATTMYAAATVRVSRRTERLLIEWIERGFLIADDLRLRALGAAGGACAQSAGFVDAALAAVLRLQPRATLARGYMRAGKSIAANATTALVDEALASFLRN